MGISKLAKLHLVEVTFTTDFALADRVAMKTRQHQQLCSLLREAGWHDVVLHIFVIGHTGVMGNDNHGILEALGIPPSQLKDALRHVAALGCRFSCDMLKAFWRNKQLAVEPTSDAPSSPHIQPAQHRSCGVVTPARRGGRAAQPRHADIVIRSAARKRSQHAPCAASGKRRKLGANVPPCTSHDHASQPLLGPSAPITPSHPQQGLRRSARLDALHTVAPLPPLSQVTSFAAKPLLRIKRPLAKPT